MSESRGRREARGVARVHSAHCDAHRAAARAFGWRTLQRRARRSLRRGLGKSRAKPAFAVADEELKRSASELAELNRRSEASLRHYRELFDGAPDGYALTDAYGTVREGNATLASMLGVHSRFLDGKPLVGASSSEGTCALSAPYSSSSSPEAELPGARCSG